MTKIYIDENISPHIASGLAILEKPPELATNLKCMLH
jgi:hypothetical protein